MKPERPDSGKLDKSIKEASFFKTLIEYTRDPVYVLDPNDAFRMVYANQAACRHFGVDLDRLLTMRIPDWDPVFDMDSLNANMEEMKQGRSIRFETVHRVASGELVPVEVTGNYLVHEGRELVAGYFYDISERKVLEQALRESERNLIEAQRIACVGNWAKDLSGNFVSASAECYRLLGVEPAEFTGRMEVFLQLVHPDDRDRVRSAVEKLLSDRLPYSVEFRVILKDGSERIIHEKGEAVVNEHGKPVRLVGTDQDITERKRVEDALGKSEERYFLAVDGANDGIWERDLLTGEVFFSPRWKSMLGYKDDEISNNIIEWEKRIHPDDRQRVMDISRAYLDGHIQTYEIEYRLQHKNGSYRWVHTRGSCLRDPYGIPYRIAGSNTDITSKEIANEIRRQNEALLRTVLETLPVGILILERDGTIAISNEAARKIWSGVRYVGINGYDLYKAWWHETGKKIEKEEWAGARAIMKGETSLGELVDIECFDGSRKTIVNSAVPLLNDKEEIFAAVIVNEEITELIRAEKSLVESEKKFRTLFEDSKDTIFVSDKDRWFLDINRAGIELFGYSKKELLSMDPVKLYCDPEDRKQLRRKLGRAGFVNNFEVEMKRKDGEKIVVQLSVSAIKDEKGQVTGYQGIIRDVTERKRLERQLMQAQKMESIGVLAGGVAHDFNNLLTAISGYGQILQESVSADDELMRESIAQVLKAAERAADLTRSLLAFSRKQIINPKPVSIDAIIGNTGKLIQRIIGEDIEFITAFSEEKLIVMADPGQIELVLMNLAANARDAMPRGGRLLVSTSRAVVREGKEEIYDLRSPGPYALISVADSGTGIDKKSIERMFEPFFTTKEVGKGTGLGLSIVHGIIKQHEGSVLVSSEPGKGTTFNLYLPLAEGVIDGEQPEKPALQAKGMETLLVAEDEEVVKDFLKRILERAGYKVIAAGDGEEAVELFRKHRGEISLVISDVVMPKKNGKEISDEIRKIKPGMKVVFMSGYTADLMHSKGILENGVDFITKPFPKAELLRKVRETLDKG
ncbi:MAG TPA: PAS domain S-box protein [Geobacteraceae bacterium]|nr:PAS domain S-box protein [Geobacteraceae bacterium]